MLNPNQIRQILDIIKLNNLVYFVGTVGHDTLNQWDREFLEQNGVDLSKFEGEFTPFEQMFYFGRLSQVLSDSQAKELNYNDLLQYVKKGQYEPLNSREQRQLKISKEKTYNHIKSLNNRQEVEIAGIISDEAAKQIVKEEIEKGVLGRDSISNISNEIGKRTGQWNKDLQRIVDTEYNNIFQEGRAQEIMDEEGANALVFKEVYPLACRHCVSAYLTNGIGSKPKVFKLQELIDNGTNVGKKVSDWKPVISSMHPHCRCNLKHLPPNQEWDEENKRFKIKKYDAEKDSPTQARIKIQVNNKTFFV